MSVSRNRPTSDGRSMDIAYGAKKASTAIALNTLLTVDANGQLLPATSASPFVVGVSLSTVLATDDNYATTAKIQYDRALDGDTFIMDVDDASTAGFVAGVERPINNAGEIQAVAAQEGEFPVVRVVEVLTAQNKAVVELITQVSGGASVPVVFDAPQQAINANGAISITSFNTAITSVNTTGQTFTLADGTYLGQKKRIQLIVDGGDATVTFNGTATVVFADVGDVVELAWNGADWLPVALYNCADGATAPVYTAAS
jgi:hypothetical protein